MFRFSTEYDWLLLQAHVATLQMSSWAPPARVPAFSLSHVWAQHISGFPLHRIMWVSHGSPSFPLALPLFSSRGRRQEAESCHPTYGEVWGNHGLHAGMPSAYLAPFPKWCSCVNNSFSFLSCLNFVLLPREENVIPSLNHQLTFCLFSCN